MALSRPVREDGPLLSCQRRWSSPVLSEKMVLSRPVREDGPLSSCQRRWPSSSCQRRWPSSSCQRRWYCPAVVCTPLSLLQAIALQHFIFSETQATCDDCSVLFSPPVYLLGYFASLWRGQDSRQEILKVDVDLHPPAAGGRGVERESAPRSSWKGDRTVELFQRQS